jgi:(p)ppGpp synthase/HD superfamily hydrolase
VDLHHASSIIIKEHFGQNRKVSEIPYVTHLFEVMKHTQKMYDSSPQEVKDIVLKEGIPRNDLLVSALFHDLIEDTAVSYSDLQYLAGDKIANLVGEMSRPEADGANFQEKYNWLLGFSDKSFSSIVIKIADRYANVMDYIDANKAKYAAKYALQAFPLYYYFGKHLQKNFNKLGYMGHFESIIDDLDSAIGSYYDISLFKLFSAQEDCEHGILEHAGSLLGTI